MHDPSRPFPVERLLRPKSIAIVGVSADPGSMGGRALRNVEMFEYSGDLHLVSRTNSEVSGRACVASIDDLPMGIDAMVLGLPAKAVEDAVQAAARRGVGGMVVFAAGFAEAGEEGRAQQERIAAIAREAGIALLGPNTLGLTNYVLGVPLAFGPNRPGKADGRPSLAILAQSGAMAGSMRLHAQNRGLFVSYSVATGNEAVTGLEDYLAALIEDDATNAIAVYAEQIRRPRLFLELAARARQTNKPIIVLHPGRSAKARESAASHTGALSGDYATMRALLASEAVIVVETLEEFLDTAEMLARFPNPPAKGIGIMTDSGAFRGLSLDQAEVLDCDLPEFTSATIDALTLRLPAFAEITNPLDITAQGLKDVDLYGDSTRAVLEDPNCGSVLAAVMPGSPEVGLGKATVVLAALEAKDPKPKAFVMLGGAAPVSPEVEKRAMAAGIPFFRSPERPMRALAHVTAYALGKQAASLPRAAKVTPSDPIAGSGFVVEHRGKAILAEIGITVPNGALATTVDEAVAIATRIGWPVVLKAQAAALPHKTEVSGVLIGLADEAALRGAWDAIQTSVAKARPDMVLDGLLVEGMAARGVELVVGGRNDPLWGPILVFGLGGIWTEALGDVRLTPADLSKERIKEELLKLAGVVLLTGYRGAPPVDLDAVAEVIGAVGSLLRSHPEIAEIDINPLIAYPAGKPALALDALFVVG
jgi:acetate---CoA ligase (ADP-forming)